MRWVFFALLWAAVVRAETTPLTEPLVEGRETTITCEFKGASNTTGISKKEADEAIGTYHYRLYIPTGYNANPQNRYPCLFIADPSGNAKMARYASWLKSHGYVVVMLIESKNGPWAPIKGNFFAAHDDVVKRVRIMEGLKVATGFSGGARASATFVSLRPGFCGLVLQGAGAAHVPGLKSNPRLYVAMTMGRNDNNAKELPATAATIGSSRFLSLPFDGGHTWAAAELFERAMSWIEENVYEHGPPVAALRPAYMQRLRMLCDQLQPDTTGWERFKSLDSIVQFVMSRNLAMEPVVASKLREFQAELAKLRMTPAIAQEAQAAEALRRIEQNREKTATTRFITECQNLARLYVGTEAAKRAQELAKEAK